MLYMYVCFLIVACCADIYGGDDVIVSLSNTSSLIHDMHVIIKWDSFICLRSDGPQHAAGTLAASEASERVMHTFPLSSAEMMH